MCSFEGCDRPLLAQGLCSRHYQRLRCQGRLTYRTPIETCQMDGCAKPHKAKGYCQAHYMRLRKYGSAETTADAPRLDGREAQLRHHGWTVTERGCWEWAGSRFSNGYGQVSVNNSPTGAHRLAYRTWVGPIPEGMVVRHKCDNKPCMNPEHLELGTTQDNINDRVARKGK